ncbi:MAG TPA: hypothetical protein VFY35_16590 [Burkholderiaceae bacterium]|nr:hypothetical protein [Burkholderiaceae bacterium]
MLKRWLAVLYLLALAATGLSAIALWRLRCEGFGCMGVGIGWLAWGAVLYVPALALGSVAAQLTPAQAPGAKAAPLALKVQLLAGVGLLVYWAVVRWG